MTSNFKNLNILLDEQNCKDLKDKKFKSLVVPYALSLKPYENQNIKVCLDDKCIQKEIYDNMVISVSINKKNKKTKKNKEKKQKFTKKLKNLKINQ
tara:strand:+ start:296 stop:583 length:288 start_codon:yes stop_codon:yes gene_type:complete